MPSTNTRTTLPAAPAPLVDGERLQWAALATDRSRMAITAPATDEAFMREYIKEWKRLMKATPRLAVQREP